MNTAVRAYQQAVSKRIRCRRKMRKHAMEQIQSAMDPFLSEHPEAVTADLHRAFGTPEEFATLIQKELPMSEVRAWKQEQQRTRILMGVLIGFALLVFLLVFSYRTQPVYTIDTVTVYTEETDPDPTTDTETEFTQQTQS